MQLKAAFLELSKNWEQFAIELEDSFGRFVEMEALRADVRSSLSGLSDLLDSKK